MAAELAQSPASVDERLFSIFRTVWFGKDPAPRTYHIASTLFLRLLGFIYLIAFVSFWTQLDGLIGSNGITPVQEYLPQVARHYENQVPPESSRWNVPTLAWISSSDRFLHLLCAAGSFASVLLMIGVLPMPSLIFLWACYLSLVHAGQVFTSFQWDILLLETGFIAIFLAPILRSRLFKDAHPPRLALWLLWWLLIRLMFESGVVKLTWNDAVVPPAEPPVNRWETLTAMDYHYWTQPLPIWTSFYAAQLPQWFQKLSVLGVFLIEIGSAVLVFGPRWCRYIAAASIVFLMALIAATGNYNFFNLLTAVLAITLLDDRVWPQALQRRIEGPPCPRLFSDRSLRVWIVAPFFLFAVVAGAGQLRSAAFPGGRVAARQRQPIEQRLNVSQFFMVNSYGLFRRMTETRPEIALEASLDGQNWKPYEFRWKPGDPAQRPRLVAPHQPRLDWQMWFEGLRHERILQFRGRIPVRDMSPWFQRFLMRLSHQQEEVLNLLAKPPFAEPPRFFRMNLYQYQFADPDDADPEDAAQGDYWWQRELVWQSGSWQRNR
ncbi:MAG: lipase maturation factor family protein [Pirellulales bacterium]